MARDFWHQHHNPSSLLPVYKNGLSETSESSAGLSERLVIVVFTPLTSVVSHKFVGKIWQPYREWRPPSRSRQTVCTADCDASDNSQSRFPARARSQTCRAESVAS